MENLEQIRAKNALEAGKNISKREVNKIPGLILSNGLLATIAFSIEKDDKDNPKRKQMKEVMDAAARHLKHPVFGLSHILNNCANADDLLEKLSKASSFDLQRATAEILEFIGYVKRFATKNEEE